MSTRVTRSTTRAIDALMTAPSAQPAQVSTPPATPAASKKARSRKPKSNAQQTGSSRKRARTVAKIEVDVNELPHNLESIPTPDSAEDEKPKSKKPRTSKEHSGAGAKTSGEPLGADAQTSGESSGADAHVDIEKSDADVRAPKESSSASAKKTKSKKANNYGLTPGVSPYPDWEHPTKEECYEVTRLLESVHGKTRPPPTIPAPSLTVTGCGEVPSVLDALIRTRLSAATTGKNSASAFQGLVKRFGIIKEGIGKGSVDWDAVRRADVKDVKEAIKSGGLADVKSKDIKKILDMVYEENQARRDGLISTDANAPSVPGAAHESTPEKQAEIERANSGVLSLDHLHAMKHDPNLIMSELTKYPGIGVKTASCVMLFCIQVPSFAVDTHVYRLCRYLNWVPEKATRDTAYSHCDVRIPDELKYPLHQLFIAHGKTCPRCRAATSVGSAGWEKGCVIDHLVKRHGVRKAAEVDAEDGTPAEKSKPKGKGKGKARAAPKKNKKKVELEDEESESEPSDLGSDETASEHDDSADEKESDD
ncbi:HhH-GPD family base excision DNA repair protein [Phyllosticta capitalensis]|uniref:HhH-GPD family base excision DNA repair protein n=1 Tax=Phyllosticta capitalensis TaxID=121624 RepID=A0ABR1YWP8_9PEZI